MALPLFIAIYLTPASKQALLAAVPPKHTKVYAEHLTVCFKPHDIIVEQYASRIGTVVPITIEGVAEDEKGQAVFVREQLYRLDKGVAHITISCAEGVPPKYSAELFNNGYKPLPMALHLAGSLEWNRLR